VEKNKTTPASGGCWFCQVQDDNLVFDSEFDTFVHVDCIMDNYEVRYEAEIMAYLLNDQQKLAVKNKPCSHPYERLTMGVDPTKETDNEVTIFCGKCESFITIDDKKQSEKVIEKLTGKALSHGGTIDQQPQTEEYMVAKKRETSNLAHNLRGIGDRMNSKVEAICYESARRLMIFEENRNVSDATIIRLNEMLSLLESKLKQKEQTS